MYYVKIKNIFKYLIRFIFLQTVVFITMVWYFDKYVFLNQEHKFEVYLGLVEDRDRFYDFIPLSWVTIDALFFILIFIFLVLLYTTKFYTYVNELDFSYDRKFLDDYFMLYLLWNSFVFSSLYVFRITGLSRANLVLFSFLIPIMLLLFRNSEILSTLLGRSVSNENYISFNLDEFSNFKNLRIIAFRKERLAINCDENELSNTVTDEVGKLNKIINVNLVVIRIQNTQKLSKELEEFLIKLNKKVLIISKEKLEFNSNFIYRQILVDSNNLYYFNNDIQYGAKFILKRLFDIVLSLLLIALLSPILLFITFLVSRRDGFPSMITQKRVGLHGSKFEMYKFRTMYKDSHEKRADLTDSNEKSGPLFKITSDPRIIKGLEFLRTYSLDELPQLFNVLKGNMSLVGPRPLFEEDTEYFDKNYIRRLNVLPGMTGLLQINERNTDDFEVWYKYDIEYIDNWSLYLDIKILLKTFSAVINKRNTGS
jgi:lipopolysaccharide/colanic/teichoic acid biosynthesis glycosyltransferase